MNAADTAPTLDRLTHCSAAVQQWFLQNDLQLNAGKSDVILLGTAVQLRSAAGITTIDIAGSSLPVALKLKSLGVTIDSHLRFDVHVREVVKACNHHTRALRHVRHVLSDETAQLIACSIVGSRLDYCNAILYGAPQSSLDKLQRTQNNLARVVCQRSRITDARPLLQSLFTGCQSGNAYCTRRRSWRSRHGSLRLTIPGGSTTTATADEIAEVL